MKSILIARKVLQSGNTAIQKMNASAFEPSSFWFRNWVCVKGCFEIWDILSSSCHTKMYSDSLERNCCGSVERCLNKMSFALG